MLKITVDEKTKSTFEKKVQNKKELMRAISLRALSSVQKNIKEGIKPPNSPLTKAIKKGDKTLQDRGQLLSSLHARSTETEAIVSSSHIAAAINHPDNGKKEIVIRPKKATFLVVPASSKTRTFQRRYGFSPRAVIEGLKEDGHSVYRPYKKGTATRANVIMVKKGKKGKPYPLFILLEKVTIPARPFFFLDKKTLDIIDTQIKEFFSHE